MAADIAKRKDLETQETARPIPLTFSQVSTKYLEYCQGRFQKNTWRQKAFVYRSFLRFLQDDPSAESITSQIIGEYLQDRRETSGNIAANRDLRDLKAMYNWAFRQNLITLNPCLPVDKYPETPTPRYVPPVEDINKVFLVATDDDLDLILLVYHSAGRISEILKLTWEDVNFEQRWIRLWTRKRKGGELQEDKVPMTNTALDVLQARWRKRDKAVPYVFSKNRKPYTYNQIRHLMRDPLEVKQGFL